MVFDKKDSYISVRPKPSGLNNQIMCLFGLISDAITTNRKLVLPRTLRNISFNDCSKRSVVDFKEVFDVDGLVKCLREFDLISDFIFYDELDNSQIELLNTGEAFKTGVKFKDSILKNEKYYPLITSISPSKSVLAAATDLIKKMPDKYISLQLRIEKDWQNYLDRKYSGGVDNESEFLSTDFRKILKKISYTRNLPSKYIYACCDEDDLPVSKEILKETASEYGLNLNFKSDFLPGGLGGSLRDSLMDFSICMKSKAYIGLTRSTFSNNLATFSKGIELEHFVYNNPGDFCFKRDDFGLNLQPWKKSEINITGFETNGVSNEFEIGDAISLTGSVNGNFNKIIIKNSNNNKPRKINLIVNGDNNTIIINKLGRVSGLLIRVGSSSIANNTLLEIGPGFTNEGDNKFYLFNSGNVLKIGANCMFSKNITIRCGDQPHLIFDRNTGAYLDDSEGVFIGDHVWIGEDVYITKRATIPSECIVGARSVVTKRFEHEYCAIAGNPAKVVRENVEWVRNASLLKDKPAYKESFDNYHSKFIVSEPL